MHYLTSVTKGRERKAIMQILLYILHWHLFFSFTVLFVCLLYAIAINKKKEKTYFQRKNGKKKTKRIDPTSLVCTVKSEQHFNVILYSYHYLALYYTVKLFNTCRTIIPLFPLTLSLFRPLSLSFLFVHIPSRFLFHSSASLYITCMLLLYPITLLDGV